MRWKCEWLVRAHATYLGIQYGININQSAVKLLMTCRLKKFQARIVFNRQPRTGRWKLNKIADHTKDCYGQKFTSSTNTSPGSKISLQCTASYTQHQVARTLVEEMALDPYMPTRRVQELVKAKGIFQRQPSYHHFRAIRVELQRWMMVSG